MKELIEGNLFSDISENDLFENLLLRLSCYFLISNEEKDTLFKIHNQVLIRLYNCISQVDNKYFKKDNKPYFSYIHSGQYLTYLYFLSNELKNVNKDLMNKVYYLNKILHSVDIYGEIDLPEVFFFEHPLGLVLGRAIYGKNFFAMQGCTVGGNKSFYPIIGDNVKMFSNSKILGNSKVGDNVWIAANTYVKDEDIESNCLVFGMSPKLTIKRKK